MTKQYKVIDQKTGLHLRSATIIEAIDFEAHNANRPAARNHRAFEEACIVRTGALVDTDTGPGIWFGGAGV